MVMVAGFPGDLGRVRDVPAVEPLRPARLHERNGAEQGDAGEPHVLEPRRPRQQRRAGTPDPGARVALHDRGQVHDPDG
jgi:hypothetical protein